MKNISGKELREIQSTNPEAVVLDVRTPIELEEGKIIGSININLMDQYFADRVGELDKSKTYLVVCRSGGRSGQACQFMASNGFSDVYNLAGGMLAWDGETE